MYYGTIDMNDDLTEQGRQVLAASYDTRLAFKNTSDEPLNKLVPKEFNLE